MPFPTVSLSSSSPSPRPLFLPDATAPTSLGSRAPAALAHALLLCVVANRMVTIINNLEANQNMRNHHVFVSHILPMSKNKCRYGICAGQTFLSLTMFVKILAIFISLTKFIIKIDSTIYDDDYHRCHILTCGAPYRMVD